MAYITVKKNREGKKYVYLTESFREDGKVRNRTLESFGPLELLEAKEPDILNRLRKEAKEGILHESSEGNLQVSLDLNKPITFEDKAYGWLLLDDLFNSLELDSVFEKEFSNDRIRQQYLKSLKLMVYQRILDPGSKYHTYESQKYLFGNWDLSDNDIYRSLKPLNSIKEKIELKAHEKITETTSRTGSLVFYDVTNYYFDIDFNDIDTVDEETGEILKEGLRKKGPCKSKSGKPIVQMGLFMDSNGIPISHTLFRGNQTDPTTYIPAIDQVKKQFGLERIIVVADKAMNSKKNVSLTHENEDGWLFSMKHRGTRGAPKDIQAFILDPKGWVYNTQETFAMKSTIRERKLEDKTTVKEKVLITWNKKYADREKIRRDGALEYAGKLTNAELFRQTSKKGGKRYLELEYYNKETNTREPFSPIIRIDEDQVRFDEQFDGINVLVTSELDMSDEEMIKQYNALNVIEDCFKVTKTELVSKPVYVYLDEHIKAHFMTCFLALTLIRLIQHKTKWELSSARLVEALQSARSNEIKTGFHRVQANEDLIQLLEILGIEWNRQYVRYEELKNFSKNWCTTKK